MGKGMEQEYYVGLDIGTDSVGWAITDMDYHILRRKGKSMWGIRLFESAQTAEERRTFRTNRRRLQRRKQRIQLLQELFAEEMEKVDPKFFQRLRDSAFWQDDKEENQIYSLFNDVGMTDQDYHRVFPTIYHLRAALIQNEHPYDIRLVYLALHHIMKHRGHFLFSGDMDKVTSFHQTYEEFMNCLKEEFDIELECDSESDFEDIMKNKKLSKTKKCADLAECCHITKADKQQMEILKLITGCSINLGVVFQDKGLSEIEHAKFSFADGNYEETRLALEDEIQEQTGIIDIFHSVYNWVILSDILSGGEYQDHSYLSFAKKRSYDKHHEDLQKLKDLLREYAPEEYSRLFSAKGLENNYSAYIGMYKKNGKKISVKRCTQEDFYKTVRKILKTLPQEHKIVQEIIADMDAYAFMPLQISKDNGVIPYQVHAMELEAILENARSYLPFLNQVDETCGKTVGEKIKMLFEFRIPYYVGPLNTSAGENCWMIRKEDGQIRPWNFDQKVDVDQSASAFIQRMTNQCTYLTKEDVLPKHSLLYSEYMVLNELNNVKIRGEKLSVELKQNIYKNLFMKYKQVTGKRLLDYLISNGYEVTKEDLSGLDGNFKASLSSYILLKEKVFGEDINKISVHDMAEDLILWITLYGEDPKMLERVIRKHYQKQLSEEQIKNATRLKFQGWGRLSKAFLAELRGADRSTGESMTIIQGLRNTQNNLMQLLSSDYTFTESIKEENDGYQLEGTVEYDSLMQDIVASPAIKRAVWQTIQIVEEIKRVMGADPKRIFVEMARGPEEKVRTVSRKDRLIELYKIIDQETKAQWCKELSEKDESDFKSIKLFLYYTQMGKCMYTGTNIDLSQLNDATIWNRDHIYPQSKTKDDSLDNLVLVDSKANARKDDGMISPDTQQKMKGTWKYLLDKGLITKKKYDRLTRTTPLTEEELAGFIGRQLVETRQSTKVVATLLERIYKDSKIVYVKANAVTEFRQEAQEEDKKNQTRGSVYVKVRDMNDYHHAKDAYLNIVVGNVYYTKFTKNPLTWLKEHPNAKYSLNAMFKFDIQDCNGQMVWRTGKDGAKNVVDQTMARNDILFTRYSYCNKGGLFDQQMVGAPKDVKKAEKLVPIKKGMDTSRYGGYTSVTPSHFMLVESKDKKGNLIRSIETVPLYRLKEFERNPELLITYCEEMHGLKEPKIIIPCIKKNAKLVVNGFPMHLKGSTGKQLILQGAVQLCLDPEYAVYLKKVTKYLDDNAKRKDKKILLPVHEFSGINKEMNEKLYQIFIDKLTSSIYQYRPANPKEKLINHRENFLKLSLEAQCIVLGEILHLFQCQPITTANLILIGDKQRIGNIQINKVINQYDTIFYVSQSITGVYEQVVDLQTV